MDRKPVGTHSLKSDPTQRRRSAFEMSINQEFQVDTLQNGTAAPKAGDSCPKCQSARIDYNSMLNLSCPDCGYTLAGCFT